MKRVYVLLVAITCGLLVPACSDDSTTPADNAITGQVLDAAGLPVSDAAIMVEYELPLPDPAKPMTSIRFEIPEPGPLHLWITDPCTQESLRTLVDDTLTAGSYSVMWDARDDQGLTLTSGVYLAHMEMGGESSTWELVLMHGGFGLDADPATFRHHAQTGADGRFRLAQDCLPFGHESDSYDETGTFIGIFTISRRVKLFALHTDLPTGASDWLEVDAATGAEVTISLGK